jgi:hypothetical protein
VQQDILETFVDRGQLRKVAEPTIIPGLKLDHPRQLALMHALVRFAHIAAGNTFATSEIHPHPSSKRSASPPSTTRSPPSATTSPKWPRVKLPNSRRYQLLPQGYSICLVFLKLFERVYGPLTAGLLSPIKADARLQTQRRSQLDRLYQSVVDDLDTLVRAVGLKGRMTKTPNENKILVCYNGLNRSKWFHSSGPPPSTLIMHLRARKQLGLNILETRTYFLTYYPRTIFFTHRASGLCRYATTQSRIVHNLAHK